MNEVNIKDQLLLEEKFYNNEFYFSYSGLNKLLFSPSLFYKHYVLQEKEDKLDSYLVGGKVVHCLLLDEDKFNEQFIVSPSKIPEGNSKLIVDKIYNIYKNDQKEQKVLKLELDEYKDDIINLLKEINLHQTLKTDLQRLEKIITEQNITYFKFLILKGEKDIVDPEILENCLKKVEVIKSYPKICELLGIGSVQTNTFKVYNEILLKKNITTKYQLGLKGIIDNLVVDADEKKIYINDLKTSSKSIVEFPTSVEFYNYWMQAAIYVQLVKEFLKDYIDETWNIKFTFIVIDNYNQVYPYEVSEDTMVKWQLSLEDTMTKALWHYENRSYNLPYELASGQIKL